MARSRVLVDGDTLKVFLEEIVGGVPQSGNSPQYAMKRELGPNYWWNAGSGWQATKVWNNLVETDPTDQPGFYEDTISASDVPRSDGEYLTVQYRDTALSLYEYEIVKVVYRPRDDVWEALEADYYSTAGSMGQLMTQIAGLSFRHIRQFNHVYSGDQLTAATIRVYRNNADLVADTNHILELTWQTSYSAGKPDESTCTT